MDLVPQDPIIEEFVQDNEGIYGGGGRSSIIRYYQNPEKSVFSILVPITLEVLGGVSRFGCPRFPTQSRAVHPCYETLAW